MRLISMTLIATFTGARDVPTEGRPSWVGPVATDKRGFDAWRARGLLQYACPLGAIRVSERAESSETSLADSSRNERLEASVAADANHRGAFSFSRVRAARKKRTGTITSPAHHCQVEHHQ